MRQQGKGLPMYRVREILRLHYELHLSDRAIARAHGLHHSTVSDLLRRFESEGGQWPLPAEMTDRALHQWLYRGHAGRPKRRPEPDWAEIHAELRRKGVTLQLLWQEYRAQHPDGYQYSRFCDRYRQYVKTLDVVLRKTYRPGEYAFVDYAGPTVPIVHPKTGEIQAAQVFVAVLGYSHYTFVELHPQQTTAWWIRGHVHALEYFGGVPKIIVPDNPKPLVSQVERFDVQLNRSYQEFATHYGAAIVPARPRKPRDKAPVEAGVLLVERWILAALRHARFVGWDHAQQRVRELLDRLNARPFQKWAGSRRTLWEEERRALAPLPATAYQYAEWRTATVHRDYHVEVDRRYYSVPYQLVGQRVDVRLSATTVECFQAGERVASHPRDPRVRWHTRPEHMPPHHRAVQQGWDPALFRRQAAAMGPHTHQLIDTILTRAVVPQQVFRRCQGILALAQRYSPEVLEMAAQRAVQAEAYSYGAVQAFCAATANDGVAPASRPPHANVRGPQYFGEGTSAPSLPPA